LDRFKQLAFYFWRKLLAFKSATTTASAAASTSATTVTTATAITAATAAATLALGHHVDAGASGIRLALTATLGFVAKGIDAALGT
jgi:hypothetical protein